MKLFLRRTSLSLDFFLFSLIIFLAVMVLSVDFWLQAYRGELNKKYELLPTETTRIDSVLSDAINYMYGYAEFIGTKIVEHEGRDLNYIAALMGGKFRTQPQENDSFMASTFDWVTPDKQLRVSNRLGILPTPYDMSDRDYLQRTPLFPWTLQISAPRFGGISNQWIIPAGMGVTAPDGRFLGTVTMGLVLDALNRKIAQVMTSPDIRYLILTRDMKLVLDSGADNSLPNAATAEKLPHSLENFPDGSGYLEKFFVLNNVNYSYYKNPSRYPYVILVGYKASMADTLFNELVLSRILGLCGIGAVAIFILYLMRRRLIKPVLELVRKADDICAGRDVKIPESNIREIEALRAQLQNIANYVANERKIRQELAQKSEQLQSKAHELELANARAVEARDAAVKADQAKSEFLANISHEIRTPMNAVLGLTNILLMQEHTPERRKECLQTMQMSAQQLLELINDLLDISKLESQNIQLESIPIDLAALAGEIMRMHTLKAREKGLSLSVQTKGNADMLLLGDPLRLRQILTNLIGNAIKFTEKGGITVTIDSKPHATLANVMDVGISVDDTGIGIPQDKLPTIFSKFHQADSSITRKYGGTGLGLSICKSLTEIMGGAIAVKSKPGHGSCFHIRLPLSVAQGLPANDTTAKLPLAVIEEEKESNRQYHILLVEDNEANILVATSLLDNLGYTHTVARCGAEAIALIQQRFFSLVLMDVQMPEMDGLEVTRRLRASEKANGASHIPILGMTAHAMVDDKQRCLSAGMDDYLPKPFDVEYFATLLKHYRRKPTAQAQTRLMPVVVV